MQSSNNQTGGESLAANDSVRPHEPADIRRIRTLLTRWPFKRGKGILLRLFDKRLRDRDFLIEIEPGVLIPGDLDDWMVLSYFANGCEHDLPFQLSRSLIRPGDTVMDIGANIGLWVMGAARKTGPSGQLHAFEPVPDNFARLTRNLALNRLDHVICEELALSDKSGHITFYIATDDNSGLGSLEKRERADLPIERETVTLDEYCEKRAINHIDLIKIDVEGAECLVFRGGRRVLSSATAPIIMFETDETLTARFDSSSTITKGILHEYGYDCYRYHGSRLEPVAVDTRHPAQEDLFALKAYHFEQYPLLSSLRH